MSSVTTSIDNTNTDEDKKKKKKAAQQQASIQDTLHFVFSSGNRITILFFCGCIAGFFNGLVFPALAYLFSNSFKDISSAGTSSASMGPIRELAYTFMVVGVYALVVATAQSTCFELVAHAASRKFQLDWFQALLRQDASYFDVKNVSGLANQVGPASTKFKRGLGRKFGEGIQFLTTGLGGLVYALYSSWKVALVVLAILPFVSLSALAVLQLNQTKGTRAAKAYQTAGAVAYTSVSSIKTVLSLNGVQTMMAKYAQATQTAYDMATGILIKQGFANGSMLASFLMLYAILTIFGSYLLYRDVRDDGCDPSAGIGINETCENSGPDVFGAMLGVAFAAQGLSQFGNFSEAFTAARVACFTALETIQRKVGDEQVIIYHEDEEDTDDAMQKTQHSKGENILTDEHGEIKAILPKYEIDAVSTTGITKTVVSGRIEFDNVSFAYPTRPGETVLNGLSTRMEPGETVAFVGPSGSGKSTVVGILERFYDPQSGRILLDGTDLRDYNVKALRSMIGYVGQEPTLFACSILDNIQYGKPDATRAEIEQAAKLANAHDFITSLTNGYDTQVGDKGSQLSGGQKQRIAIARVLIGDPKILILDEATSALDAESELVVQEALDNILSQKAITTIIIAHRLSTIRNCDTINVLVQGQVAEQGTHDSLMAKEGYYYKLVQKQDGHGGNDSGVSSRTNSVADLEALDDEIAAEETPTEIPHLRFNNVGFAYPSRPKKIIFKKFSLDIKRGSTVALVGPSGGGKSTTVGLIERFYDPLDGAVEYMGTPLTQLHLPWYRSKIGYVGQEPTLFNDTIANNIAFGLEGVTREQIKEAAMQANAHDFIAEFADGYDTPVGERGIQLSGGQKQRVAIARALVRQPEILLLDEATSALDNESEAIVQTAIDKLMGSSSHTCIVIAHRLSTIRDADVIAVIAGGKVVEQGSHDDLLAKPDSRYKRLFESSLRNTIVTSASLAAVEKKKDTEEEEENWETHIEESENAAFDSARARRMAAPDGPYLLLGAFGGIFAGAVFPMWGLLFAETMDILFKPVFPCPSNIEGVGELPGVFGSCEDYWEQTADDMQSDSYRVSIYWAILFCGCLFGNVVAIWGFGMAAENLSKRIRDSAFGALLRQEVAFFDKRSVGSITSQLQDDAGKIQAFSGEPLRSFVIAVSSVVIGVTLSFVHMWPFALLAIACVPLMGFATSLEMSKMLGEDEGDLEAADGKNSPGGIIVETLLNMRTVSALTLEQQRFADYEAALAKDETNVLFNSFLSGGSGGISQFIQQWINGLQFWFGGWLLFNYPNDYEFRDFLVANFAVLFALFGLGAAFQDVSDRKQVEKSVGRIFYLLDRKSAIDPLMMMAGKDPTFMERQPQPPPDRLVIGERIDV